MADRRRQGPRSFKAFHHYSKHVWQRAIELAQQYACAMCGPCFPNVTAYDNVRQQYRLVTEKFGIETIKLVTGWSMGGLQTYHWARSIPTWSRAFCRSRVR